MNHNITNREREVLTLIAKGMSSKNIANELNLSIHTVTTHRKNILRKLNQNTTILAIIQARSAGLLEQTEMNHNLSIAF